MASSITEDFRALEYLTKSMRNVFIRMRETMGANVRTSPLQKFVTTPAEERALRALFAALETYQVAVGKCQNASDSIANNVLLHIELEDPIEGQDLLDWLDEAVSGPPTARVSVSPNQTVNQVLSHTQAPMEPVEIGQSLAALSDTTDGLLGRLKLNCFVGLNVDTTEQSASGQVLPTPVVADVNMPTLMK